MTPSEPNAKVNWYFEKAQNFKPEQDELRKICLASGLFEEVKWGHPCYTDAGKHIVLIQGFKNYCALLFPNGGVLKDPNGILVRVGQNSRYARQARFQSVAEIEQKTPILLDYIQEATEAARAGLEVELDESDATPVPEEFQAALDADPALRAAFDNLTPGRQRAWLLHVNGAKQSKTRTSRVEKAIPQILDGLGLND